MNWREALICLLLFAVAFWLWKQLDPDVDAIKISDNNSVDLPSQYLDSTELTRYDKNGKPVYTITAERIEENPEDQTLLLSKLLIKYKDQTNSNTWQISADQASMPADRKKIDFQGNVVANNPDNSNSPQFTSDSLQYDIDNEILRTADKVLARQGIQRVTATGMTLNMKTQRIQLHSQVKIRIQLP